MTRSTATTLENLRKALVTEAEASMAAYPQYRGHWDGWRVAEVTRRIRTKFGVAFEPGDLVLVSSETYDEKVAPTPDTVLPYEDWPTVTFTSAWSRRNGISTAVPVADVSEVEIIPGHLSLDRCKRGMRVRFTTTGDVYALNTVTPLDGGKVRVSYRNTATGEYTRPHVVQGSHIIVLTQEDVAA